MRLTGSLTMLTTAAVAILPTVRADDVTYDLSGVNLSTTIDSSPTETIRVEFSTDPDFAATVTTYAGTQGSSGMTNGTREAALFDIPTGVARDSEGNLFIADTVNHQIRLLDRYGDVTTIAGSEFGFADGDGDSARFQFPTAVAVGPSDNLYVADTFNHAIRKITRPSGPGGTWSVTTLAGTGIAGFSNGSGLTAKFNRPQGLTLDQTGNVYVADSGNHRIRRISTDSTVSTFAGTGTQGYGDGTTTDALFDHPFGVAFDDDGDPSLNTGNLYVADRDNNRIRRIDLSSVSTNDQVETIGGTDFDAPVALVVFGDNIYVSSKGEQKIRLVDVSDEANPEITTLAGTGVAGVLNGPALTSTFHCPSGICTDDSGNLYIADAENHVIRRIITSGLTVPAEQDGTSFSAHISQGSLGLNSYETYYFRWINESNNDVSSTDSPQSFFLVDPPVVMTEAANDPLDPEAPASFQDRTHASLNASVETQRSETTVTFEYSTDQDLLGPLKVATLTLDQILDDPSGLAVDSAGNIYVSDYGTHTVYKISKTDPADGTWTVIPFAGSGTAGFADGTSDGAQFDHPVGLAFDSSDDSLYVADEFNHRIRRITQDGVVTTVAGSGIAGFGDNADALNGKLLFPTGVALFGSNLYVADRGNHRIRVLTEANSLATLAGDGTDGFLNGATSSAQFSNPTDVAVSASGYVLVADRDNHCIRLVNPITSLVSTWAGSTTAGNLDGTGTNAEFYSPSGLAIDADDNLYVADRDNHLLRLIDPSGVTTTFAGSGTAGLEDSGEGQLFPATVTEFNGPSAVAVTANTTPDIYLADPGNNALREVTRDALLTSSVILEADTSALSAVLAIPEELLPGATYYFRVSAENERTEILTEIASFTMPALQEIALFAGSDTTTTSLTSGQATDVDFDVTPLRTVVSRNFTIVNNGQWPLEVSNITVPTGYQLTSGFASALTIAAEQSLTIQVSLTGNPGATYEGDLEITSDDPDTPVFTIPLTGIVLDPPTVTTLLAEDPTLTTANLRAEVNPNGTPTTVWFAYARDPELNGFDVTTLGGEPTLGFREDPTTPAQFNGPLGLAVDTLGNIYVAETANHQIKRISPDGTSTTVAGNGTAGFADGDAATAQFNQPQDIAIGEDGTIYVADSLNHRIRVIDPDGTVRTLAGTGESSFTDGDPSAARFNEPHGIAIDENGLLYVADRNNHRIRTVESDGTTSTLAGTGVAGTENGPAATATLNAPFALVIDEDGTIYLTEEDSHTIRKISSGTVSILAGSTQGFAEGEGENAMFSAPRGLALDSSGNIVVADTGNNQIRLITPSGTVTTLAGSGAAGNSDGLGDLEGVEGTAAEFDSPASIALDPDGSLIVGEATNGTIRRIASNTILVEAATELTGTDPLEVVLLVEDLIPYTDYYVRALASNSGGTTIGTEIISFMSRPRTLFEEWQDEHFGSDADDTEIAGSDADPDGDTVVNLLEYALLTDPNDSSSGRDKTPQVLERAGRLTLTYVRESDSVYIEDQDDPGEGDLIFEVESSTDLVTWSPALDLTLQISLLDDDSGEEEVVASVPLATDTAPSPGQFQPVEYLRLIVTLQTLP
jgi:sugar lactone lactonase YvrE